MVIGFTSYLLTLLLVEHKASTRVLYTIHLVVYYKVKHKRTAYKNTFTTNAQREGFFKAVKSGVKMAYCTMQATAGTATMRGKFADIIAVTGDALTDITRIEHVVAVMKNGELVSQ